MIEKGLVNYIRQQLNSGYSPESIKQTLLRSGYAPADIEKAFSSSKKPQKNWFTLIGAAFILMIFLIIGSIFIIGNQKQEADVSLNLNLISTEIKQGDEIIFNADILNKGKLQELNFNVVTQAISSEKKVVASKQESTRILASDSKKSLSSSLLIPANALPGIYELQITIYSGTVQKSASAQFKVPVPEITSKPEQPIIIIEQKCPESCDDFNRCTEDICSAETNYRCIYMTITPCCGNNKCDIGEDYLNCPSECVKPAPVLQEVNLDSVYMEDIVVIKAKQNPADAAEFCNSLAQGNEKDDCYSLIAETIQSTAPCDSMNSAAYRDNCYIEYGVLLQDYSVCEKMTNKYAKEGCLQLREIQNQA